MQVAGIRQAGDRVELIDVAGPRPLAGDEVLLEVMAAGVGNWDEFARTGGWDVGARPPMALGVEAAGTVVAAGPPDRIARDPRVLDAYLGAAPDEPGEPGDH